MKKDTPEPTALEKAMTYLSRRGHSEAELSAKLHRAGFGRFEISHALEECRRLGLVNDELFARRVALTENGDLVIQYYWEQDGAPMVSYSYFKRG